MDTIIIGIAGGTGSGKSTFTNRLRDEFGDQVAVIYHDNYYKAQDDMPFEKRVKQNYDHPDAFETDLLVEHLKALRNGESIECPVYDYTVHNRSKETVLVVPKPVIILEGILVLSDKRLREQMDSNMLKLMDMILIVLSFREMFSQRSAQSSPIRTPVKSAMRMPAVFLFKFM